MSEAHDHTILICATCAGGPEAARRMRGDLTPRLPAGFTIRPVDCMAGCDTPTTVGGVQAPGKASYLFGPIENAADITALAEFARQYAAHDTGGWTSASDRPPKALYHKTLARLPGGVKAREAAHV